VKQLQHEDFVQLVTSIVERFQINPYRLKLELTESMLVENVEETIAKIEELRALGIRFSLDDFGTGYSSLQYLKKIPLDQLKIDQSFVRGIETDRHDRDIVRTVIAIAQSMDLDVIAEGVETEGQLHVLMDRGCNSYQGYLFGKPLPIAQFEQYL
jgi:EAL domain-containing protein (putative c-di-GMP-specific phosphodiesterase class I)